MVITNIFLFISFSDIDYISDIFLCCVHVDVTKVLSELELLIQRVKVMTTPDGKVLDLFLITDVM